MDPSFVRIELIGQKSVYAMDYEEEAEAKNLPIGITTLPWDAAKDSVLYMRPLDPAETYHIYNVLPACTSWYKGGVLVRERCEAPRFIPAGTGVCVTADLMADGWAATKMYLE